MGFWTTWSGGRCPCSWWGGWNLMIFKVPSYPTHSLILRFYDPSHPSLSPQWLATSINTYLFPDTDHHVVLFSASVSCCQHCLMWLPYSALLQLEMQCLLFVMFSELEQEAHERQEHLLDPAPEQIGQTAGKDQAMNPKWLMLTWYLPPCTHATCYPNWLKLNTHVWQYLTTLTHSTALALSMPSAGAFIFVLFS